MDNLQIENLPELFQQGTEKKEWEDKRKKEILSLFENEVYGVIPDEEKIKVTFRLAFESQGPSIMGGNAKRKTIEITAERNGVSMSFPVILFIPVKPKKKVGAFITICNRGLRDADPARSFISPFWPAESIISRGYATAAILTHDIAPDYYEGYTMGFHKLFPEYKGNRPSNCFGAITAWAWGASKVLDYMCLDEDIDENKVAVVGHSRGGKTALWATARDPRFAMGVSSSSGCTGAAITRGKDGEHLIDINTRFPYWFCGNYKKYNNREDELPIDQHMLLSLIAPRAIYVSSKTFDTWADPKSEFMSCVKASPAYELYNLKGIETKEMPSPDCPLLKGQIGYHNMTGYHDMTQFDWERYLDFADLIFK